MSVNKEFKKQIVLSALPDISPAEMDFPDSPFFQSGDSPKPKLPTPASILQQYGDQGACVIQIEHLNMAVKINHEPYLRLEGAQTMRAVRRFFPDGEVPAPEVFEWRKYDGLVFIYSSYKLAGTQCTPWTRVRRPLTPAIGWRGGLAVSAGKVKEIRVRPGTPEFGPLLRGMLGHVAVQKPVESLRCQPEPFPSVNMLLSTALVQLNSVSSQDRLNRQTGNSSRYVRFKEAESTGHLIDRSRSLACPLSPPASNASAGFKSVGCLLGSCAVTRAAGESQAVFIANPTARSMSLQDRCMGEQASVEPAKTS
ncbi:hypothetical protein B0J15DRAFT_576817 [Fusarium solani]|jgi:hypothetical protein|uniref:Uncharacterized protein n=2 Tax=Fusarium solani TaxID=169388 RepID=A0A9P9L032_FUSSL|nr:uncharacterized protein B0J15DRAFT_576817 [Fusarium solani]KAH7271696.1 hypothetical protein B0J15DRAFT_576817 [Fusarium solani]